MPIQSIIVLQEIVKMLVTKKILMDAMYKRFPIIRIRCILYPYAVVATKELTTSLLMKTF